MNNLYRKKRDITIVETPALDEILKAHMVEGFLDTASINDEQILETVNGYDIRMTVYNTYPQRSVMANCAKVKITKEAKRFRCYARRISVCFRVRRP